MFPRRLARAAAVAAAGAAAAPATALAHATLVRTVPADGSVVASAPRQVTVIFDDTVIVGKGNAAVANGSGDSVLAGRATARGHDLVLPLRSNLPDGDYSVRWSIVSDDGHPERGVIAFGVGAGRAPPTAVLTAITHASWVGMLERGLYLFGLLVAGGAAAFGLLARPVLGDRLAPRLAQLLFFSLLLSFLGASALLQAATAGTRYDHVLTVSLVVTVAGAAAAALAPVYPRLLYPASACAFALLAAPTLSGHALDRDQPRVPAVIADVAHVAAAAVWLGGLVALAVALPAAKPEDAERQAVIRRFSTTALVSVSVLATSGLVRALTEFRHIPQVWSTSYGQAILVKTALFLPLLGLGWLNRSRLLGAFRQLRRSVSVEILLLAGVVAAVAVLVQLRPPKADATRSAVAVPGAPLLPSRAGVVDAHAVAGLAVGIARVPGSATVTILGPDGTGVTGERVTIDGRTASACGTGCYAGPADAGPVGVGVGSHATTFDVPARAPDGTALLRAVTARYRGARTILYDETLSATGRGGVHSRFTIVAPHRLAYTIAGGPSAIVIGARRWDSDAPGKPFVASPQTPLDVTQPFWSRTTNAHEVAPGILTFLDRSLPAWFRLTLKGPLPRVLHMTAAAHFMTERYSGFDVPAAVSPPSR